MRARTGIIKVINIITVISIFIFLPYVCATAQTEGKEAKPEGIAVPSELKIASADTAKIELQWQDNSDNESGFEVHRKDVTNKGKREIIATVEANVATYSDTGVVPWVKYAYWIKAFNDTGKSKLSKGKSVAAGVSPEAPAEVKIVSADTQGIELAWQDTSDNEEGFEVLRRNFTKKEQTKIIDTLGPNVTTYRDTNVTPDYRYGYRIRPFNIAGKADLKNQKMVMVISGTLPEIPSDLKVVTATEDRIEISWQDNSDNETGFEIWRMNVTEKGKYGPIDTVRANVTSYIDTNVTTNIKYGYFIRAFHGGGKSKSSKSVSAITGFPPDSPSDIEITSERVDLRWVDNSDNEDGFKIWRKNMEIEGAKHEVIGQVEANETTYTDETATPGVKYAYEVKAFNNAGYSKWAKVAIVAPAGLPVKPTGLEVVSANSDEVKISWQDNSDNENGFEILRLNITEGGDFEAIDTVANEATSYIDKTVAPSASYEYKVSAFNSAGDSISEETIKVTTQ